jgi:hypothetical protein
MPGPLVETGSLVARVWAVADCVDDGFGDRLTEGDGDDETSGDGDGAVGVIGVTGWTALEGSVAEEVFWD